MELLARLLDHEQHGGERRVEGGGQARRGTGGQQRVEIDAAQSQPFRQGGADGRAHVDGRSLAAGDQAGRQGQHAADELDRQHAPPAHLAQSFQRAFDLRHAAARGLRRDALRQQEGQRDAHGGDAAAAAMVSGPGPRRSASQIGQRSRASTARWKAPPTIPVAKPQAPATQ